jgi:hypothetical protein
MIALLHTMRLVVITALGWPVEPDVSRNLTMVSEPVSRWRASSSLVAGASRPCNVVTAWPATAESPTISTSRSLSCVSTRA